MHLVHIPKTGGTSIAAALGIPGNDHLPASRIPRPRFAVVRNPYDRIVSAWEFCRAAPAERLRAVTAGTTFDEFVRLPDDGIFLTPQAAWLDAPMDMIGRFERLEADFAQISDTPLPHLRASERRPWAEYYDAETRAHVAHRYREDFVRFGYVA